LCRIIHPAAEYCKRYFTVWTQFVGFHKGCEAISGKLVKYYAPAGKDLFTTVP